MSARPSASVPPASVLALGATRRRRPLVRRVGELPRGPLALALLAAVAVIASHLLDFGLDHLRLALLDADSAGSWSHLLADAVLVLLTGMALAGAARLRRERWLWWVTTAAFAFLAADELSPLHAQVDQLSWGKLMYVPALVVLCLCLWRLSRPAADRLAPRIGLRRSQITGPALLVRVGLATLVLSYGIHVLGPHLLAALGWGTGSWAYQVKVGVKEASELAGWLLMACGLASLSRSR